jgi:hypothetical protein
MGGDPAIPQNQVPTSADLRETNERKPTAWWRERMKANQQRSGKETKKAGTRNSVRGARVVADDEDVKTTRE